ncbi:SCO family protein [Pseudolabrys taiwanensis]|nr:SCO family protein [Pseudolabrys taiwanensis]
MRIVVAAFMLALGATGAHAGLLQSALTAVGVSPPPEARLPLQPRWRDLDGRETSLGAAMGGKPTLVLFADYTCSSLCGPALAFVGDALEKSGLTAKDYRLIVLGLDPKDSAADARAMREREAPGKDLPLTMLIGDEQTIHAATQAIGYRYTYDAEHDQYAHPAAILAVSGDGRVVRVVSALGISPNDLRLALTEAGRGLVGSFADHVRLLCYGFDPSVGAYTLSIQRALAASGAVTVTVLAGGIAWLAFAARRSRPR